MPEHYPFATISYRTTSVSLETLSTVRDRQEQLKGNRARPWQGGAWAVARPAAFSFDKARALD